MYNKSSKEFLLPVWQCALTGKDLNWNQIVPAHGANDYQSQQDTQEWLL